jgi:hypothetical protein
MYLDCELEINHLRHVNACDQCEDASSNAKRTPPIGDPNAAAIPAAAPLEIKSLLSYAS